MLSLFHDAILNTSDREPNSAFYAAALAASLTIQVPGTSG